MAGGRSGAADAAALDILVDGGLIPVDDRPLSVRIDRDPEWSSFDYVAHIVQIHVLMTNQTSSDLEIASYEWEKQSGPIMSNIAVQRQIEIRRGARPQLVRHGKIEAGHSEDGWAVTAIPFEPTGAPQLPTFKVHVTGYAEPFEARRD